MYATTNVCHNFQRCDLPSDWTVLTMSASWRAELQKLTFKWLVDGLKLSDSKVPTQQKTSTRKVSPNSVKTQKSSWTLFPFLPWVDATRCEHENQPCWVSVIVKEANLSLTLENVFWVVSSQQTRSRRGRWREKSEENSLSAFPTAKASRIHWKENHKNDFSTFFSSSTSRSLLLMIHTKKNIIKAAKNFFSSQKHTG